MSIDDLERVRDNRAIPYVVICIKRIGKFRPVAPADVCSEDVMTRRAVNKRITRYYEPSRDEAVALAGLPICYDNSSSMTCQVDLRLYLFVAPLL